VLALSTFSAIAQQPDRTRQGPVLKRIVGIEYPWFARFGAIQGTVNVVAAISRDGSVRHVRVTSGPTPLAAAVQDSISKWTFEGCTSEQGGCEMKIQVSFLLTGSCDASSRCPSEFEADLPDRVTVRAKVFRAVVN
jgi:outer membrane biosynthesis protein TonB